MAERANGCALLIVGFVLGVAFSVFTRPEPTPVVMPVPITYEGPAAPAPNRTAPAAAPAGASEAPAAIEAPHSVSAPHTQEPAPVPDDKTELRLPAQSPAPAPSISDDEIRERIIQQSLSSYAGSCPCPYNTDRAGRRCGARSAYSRPGGAAPLCYGSDITEAQVQIFRSRR